MIFAGCARFFGHLLYNLIYTFTIELFTIGIDLTLEY